jgi:AcrR family transcriptional regulator
MFVYMGSNSEASSEPRGPGRPRDEDVRKRVLKAASDLLEEVGFTNITIEAIADRAGAGKATIYRWWPTKPALLIEAFRQAVSPEFPFTHSGSLINDIAEQLRRFAHFLLTRKGRLLAAMVVGGQQDSEVAAALRDHWIAPLRKRGTAVLEQYRRQGKLPVDISLDLVQDLMYAPLYYNLLTEYTPITDEYAEALARAVLDGIGAHKAGRSLRN